MKKICICGGGALGHTIAGFIAAQHTYNVSVLTSHPELWDNTIIVETPDKHVMSGKLFQVTNNCSIAIADADIVLLCVPGYGIEPILRRIKPYVSAHTLVGSVVSSTGFFFQAIDILPHDIPLFGFQRVPFIARTIEYGKTAKIKGYKKELFIATENASKVQREFLANIFHDLFMKPIGLLSSHYEASLTNSNPLLHTSRLYSMWSTWRPGVKYKSCPLFYADWTEEAAQLYIDMDKEFQEMLDLLPVEHTAIPNVLDYYESHDAISLCNKLRSISAFQGIYSPMIGNEVEGFEPDFRSRYFTEDFPYGLKYIVKLAHKLNSSIMTIDKVYAWGIKMISDSNLTVQT